MQGELWAAVAHSAVAQPTPVAALAAGGMNDVLNSQGYTQAAWWNRIPEAAWGLMFLIAIFANWMLGYGARQHADEAAYRAAVGGVDLVLPDFGYRQPAQGHDPRASAESREPAG